ncbi:MAG: PASTA domain-containing protein [Acidobacteria bacterium]|nr:PASTA domain-containing protein [Acidobacteriota bacterium]
MILATLGLVFILSASAMLYVAMHKPTATVPNVTGQRLSEAEEMAYQAGLELEVKGRVHHNTLAANTVVEQLPRAGTTVKRGQALRVKVSLGPELGQTSPNR